MLFRSLRLGLFFRAKFSFPDLTRSQTVSGARHVPCLYDDQVQTAAGGDFCFEDDCQTSSNSSLPPGTPPVLPPNAPRTDVLLLLVSFLNTAAPTAKYRTSSLARRSSERSSRLQRARSWRSFQRGCPRRWGPQCESVPRADRTGLTDI